MRGCEKIAVSIGFSMVVVAAAACGVSPAPGTGTSPARALNISGPALYALATNPARWSPPFQAERACTGGLGCLLGTKKIKVDIYAEINAKDVGPNPSNPAGTLMGKLVNHGDATEAEYGLPRGPYQYLLYVFPATGPDGRWVIEQVENAPPHNHVTIKEGKFHGCGHDRTWPRSFARFLTCADGPPDTTASVRGSGHTLPTVRTAGFRSLPVFPAINLLALNHRDPAWYTCTSGCCVADSY